MIILVEDWDIEISLIHSGLHEEFNILTFRSEAMIEIVFSKSFASNNVAYLSIYLSISFGICT